MLSYVCYRVFIIIMPKKFNVLSALCLGGILLAEQQKNRITVEIYGHTYKIVGTESTGHMRLVASIVDDKMKEIKSLNPLLDTRSLAVLTAVNVVHESLKLNEKIEMLEDELKKLKG